MNETSISPGRSVGFAFWIGYVVSSVGWFILSAGLHILDDHPGFWLNVLSMCIAFGVVAPLAGLISQAAHDLLLAVWRGQLRFWYFALLLGIVVASLVAGYINYLYGDSSTQWLIW
jgi:hypothetical protein